MAHSVQIRVNVSNSKRKITNFAKFIDNFVAERDLVNLEKRQQDIEKDLEAFDRHYTELEVLDDDPAHAAARTEYEDKYYAAYGKAVELQREHAQSHRPTSDASSSLSTAEGNSQNRIPQQTSKHSLPRINLLSFNGSYESWMSFHDLFKSLVDDDKTIPDIEKLYHLKGCLKGEAAEVLSSIELSGENYLVAWTLLKERYDNRKLIKQTHIKAILTLEPVSRDFSIRCLLDRVQKHVRALDALKEPVEYWNALLVEIVIQKLTAPLREKWEEASCNSPNPTFKDLVQFLQLRAQLDEIKSHPTVTRLPMSSEKRSKSRTHQAYPSQISSTQCPLCQGEHLIRQCEKFRRLSPVARFEAAKSAKLCINCLRAHHRVADCTSSACQKCQGRHHSMLHFERSKTRNDSHMEQASANQSTISMQARISSEGLLATALVDVVNSRGDSKTCRAFLDAGSQANFITHSVASFLKLPRRRVDVSVSGIDNSSTEVKEVVCATVRSRFNKYSKNLEFLVLQQITKPIPAATFDPSNIKIPQNIALADPNFHKSSEVDLLIGVKLFFKLLSVGQISLTDQPNLILQKTHFGWVVAGDLMPSPRTFEVQCHLTHHSTPLDADLVRFWEVEELSDKKILSPEEQRCEQHYASHTQRNSEGRYIVRLPFNERKAEIGKSRDIAFRRFCLLEKRFARDAKLKLGYCNFIDEYMQLKHLSSTPITNPSVLGFYLPHHAIVKEDSLTTKIRVVFDGSAKSSSGVSLNDALMVGPTIQDDLCALITRFRTHTYALTADIEKMYRQILVHPADAAYQRILFRKNPGDRLEEYTLDTVTYGTSSAPFLAIRTLHQLAEDEGRHHPVAASVLRRDFYVDDLLSGANTLEDAAHLRDDLISLLRRGGFAIRKWASNEPSLLPHNRDQFTATQLSLDRDTTVKTLGVQWNPHDDTFTYKVNLPDPSHAVTKRSILSQIAKLFDPLGLVGPVIVKAKIMLQLLWKAGISWDSSVPIHIHTMWIQFREQLPRLAQLQFKRLIVIQNAVHTQLHGFCDASESAYGACIYLRSTNAFGKTQVSLVCSKSRVAPVKPLTLPRLELCAALLLARLYTVTRKALHLEINQVYFWSDSTITLHWLRTEPHHLKTFVSNRVAEVQRLSDASEWRHVPTQENPADLVSRGQLPHEFLSTNTWQNGPRWLIQDDSTWPQDPIQLIEIPERRAVLSTPAIVAPTLLNKSFIEKYSSLRTLQNVVAYILRFIRNARKESNPLSGPLTVPELDAAHRLLVVNVQSESFFKELEALARDGQVDSNSRLIPLNPFIDSGGILRVGGRLANSDLPSNQKHPILLPPNHPLTRLIIRKEHERLRHSGVQATLYSIRENYWPLDGRNAVRKILHECTTCFRAKPRGVDYRMGDLPFERVSTSRPFQDSGVDYCGPLYIKERRHRNRSKLKVYVAIFVCLSTKASHLELVSDLTTEAFIACLKRFFARRGISKTIHSDNATNFVGASRELATLYKSSNPLETNAIHNFLNDHKVTWNFIPPRSPHFGGLWEAAVRSFKHHFVRTVGDTLLTFEQLETFVIEIEAILNSRPISPMSADPNDLRPLTPGHFLTGGPLTSFPQVDFTRTQPNRLSAWQHAQQMRQHFWNRWQKEYLHHLTVRSKWRSNSGHNIKEGDLVLIHEDNLPPLQWKLGRITATHPGADGIVRVATIKTETGIYKRCVKKLYPLPIVEPDHLNGTNADFEPAAT